MSRLIDQLGVVVLDPFDPYLHVLSARPWSYTHATHIAPHPRIYYSVEYATLTAPITMGQQLASPADAGKPPVVSFNGTDATKTYVAVLFITALISTINRSHAQLSF